MKRLLFISILIITSLTNTLAKGPVYSDNFKLKTDLDAVWPLVQIVKLEYSLAMAHVQNLKTDEEKAAYMDEFEEYIKDKYWDNLFELKLQQGKLLLLLIDREIGKTPYELLSLYRNSSRANFWQRFAWIFGADLKGEYSIDAYPQIEKEIRVKLYASKKIM